MENNCVQEAPNSQDFIETIKNFCLEILDIDGLNYIICFDSTLSDDILGICRQGENLIRLNPRVNNKYSLIKTIFHECRHYYQFNIEKKVFFQKHYGIDDNIGVDSFDYLNWVFDKIVLSDEYEQMTDEDKGKLHVEVDAEVFSALLLNHCFNKDVGIGIIDEEHKDLVSFSLQYYIEWFNDESRKDKINKLLNFYRLNEISFIATSKQKMEFKIVERNMIDKNVIV